MDRRAIVDWDWDWEQDRDMTTLRAFDRKFGEEYISSLPVTPGVYLIYSAEDALIYVGKAINLRRRLGQYRNAKRRKKQRKMRWIIADAERIEIRPCATELDACLEELRLIQEHRPKWNVAGAYYFLYPMIGLKRADGVTSFCYTTQPEAFPGFEFHGAYRSRLITGEAFFSWMKLLGFIGHRTRRELVPRPKHSYVFSFRQIPQAWVASWSRLLQGESREALKTLAMALLENAGARKDAAAVEEGLQALARFWQHEAEKLAALRREAGYEDYPVPQRERDLIGLRRSGMVLNK